MPHTAIVSTYLPQHDASAISTKAEYQEYAQHIIDDQATTKDKAAALDYLLSTINNDQALVSSYATLVSQNRTWTIAKQNQLAIDFSFLTEKPTEWFYQGTQQSKWKPSAAGITKIINLGVSSAAANALEFYLTADYDKGFSWLSANVANYTDIGQSYPYAVFVVQLPASKQDDTANPKYLYLTDKGPAGSNDWWLGIIRFNEFDPSFPTSNLPINAINVVNSIHNYTFGSQGTINITNSNPPTSRRVPNDLTEIV